MNTRAAGITGGQVFAVIATFFAIIIAVNATMAVFAMRSWSGLVVANGYVASQAFNKELAEARHQAQLGWRESFGYADGKLTLTLSDAQSRAIGEAQVNVRLERPSTDREDRDLVLREVVPGKYELAGTLSPGLWDAETIARTAAGASLRRLYRFHVPGGSAK
jgi:nitrogen fixation protein FixH